MYWYRLYFLDASHRIIARDDFEAEDDQSAITIAGLVYDACSDVSSGFELWSGTRRLVPDVEKQTAGYPSQNSAELMLRVQDIVLEREKILQQSRWLIAKSKRLQARVDELREAGFQ